MSHRARRLAASLLIAALAACAQNGGGGDPSSAPRVDGERGGGVTRELEERPLPDEEGPR